MSKIDIKLNLEEETLGALFGISEEHADLISAKLTQVIRNPESKRFEVILDELFKTSTVLDLGIMLATLIAKEKIEITAKNVLSEIAEPLFFDMAKKPSKNPIEEVLEIISKFKNSSRAKQVKHEADSSVCDCPSCLVEAKLQKIVDEKGEVNDQDLKNLVIEFEERFPGLGLKISAIETPKDPSNN